MHEYIYTFIGFILNIKALYMSIQLKSISLELPGMIYNCHRPALFEHICNKEAVWTIPAGRKYPPGKEGRRVVASTAIRMNELRCCSHDLILSFSMPSNPMQSKCRLQALHGNEASFMTLLYPTRRLTQNTIMREHGLIH